MEEQVMAHMLEPEARLQATFRDTMATVCTPVSVVTAMDGKRPHGTTVSAFASLSMTPPMVLVALDRGSSLLTTVREGRRFGVNILAAEQSDLAGKFARKGADKFEGVAWELDDAVPRIGGVGGFLACRVTGFVDGGDHVVVLGQVSAARPATGSPLTYHSRVFGTHAPAGSVA
ncbi:flavin reductase family protein [Nocardia cyriacigeorgica]|nr:flavin reductase family protein [Nocardia cyriacigeorgica]